MAKILVVDDDVLFANSMKEWLEFDHHKVDMAHDAEEATQFIKSFDYDILLLDWQLPGMSGVDLCKRYRTSGGGAYVIMLTGLNSVENKVEGLEAGADDYLAKPFAVKELMSRVKALLRRPARYGGQLLKAGDLTLDTASRVVTRSGVEIQLKPLEYAVLEFFMKHPNQVIGPDALLKRVWDSSGDASTDAVYTCINRLRKKLNDSDKEAVIKTVHGVGYRFDQASG
jgi:OmpR-family two-component system manganese-sensing response regulator